MRGGVPNDPVDIAADLNAEDDTGYVWTFLDEATDPSIIVPGALVIAGDVDAPAVAVVVSHDIRDPLDGHTRCGE